MWGEGEIGGKKKEAVEKLPAQRVRGSSLYTLGILSSNGLRVMQTLDSEEC